MEDASHGRTQATGGRNGGSAATRAGRPRLPGGTAVGRQPSFFTFQNSAKPFSTPDSFVEYAVACRYWPSGR